MLLLEVVLVLAVGLGGGQLAGRYVAEHGRATLSWLLAGAGGTVVFWLLAH